MKYLVLNKQGNRKGGVTLRNDDCLWPPYMCTCVYTHTRNYLMNNSYVCIHTYQKLPKETTRVYTYTHQKLLNEITCKSTTTTVLVTRDSDLIYQEAAMGNHKFKVSLFLNTKEKSMCVFGRLHVCVFFSPTRKVLINFCILFQKLKQRKMEVSCNTSFIFCCCF